MPFTSAFLEETWRVSTPIEKSIDHRTLEDVTLAGYNLPKNTEVMASFFRTVLHIAVIRKRQALVSVNLRKPN